MTPREQSLFTKLLSQTADLAPDLKDPTAQALLQAAAAVDPGLAYRLAYRAVLLTLALESAESELASMRRELHGREKRRNSVRSRPASVAGQH
jgi:hypothetical protein